MFHMLNGVRYDGFTRADFNKIANMNDGRTQLVAVWFEGEPELWLVDSPEAFDALKAYWRADWPQHTIEFTVFNFDRIDKLIPIPV